jgi:hypothetical protein
LSSGSHETLKKLRVAKDLNEASEFSKKGRDAEIAHRVADMLQLLVKSTVIISNACTVPAVPVPLKVIFL